MVCYVFLIVQGLVPFDNLADTAEKCSDIFNEMELQDVVQGESFDTATCHVAV